MVDVYTSLTMKMNLPELSKGIIVDVTPPNISARILP